MGHLLSINENERNELIKFHQENINRIEKLFDDLKVELLRSKQRIDELSKIPVEEPKTLFPHEKFSPFWTLVRKAEFVLLSLQRIATTREIAEMISSLIQKSGFAPTDVKEIISNLGATLKQKTDKNDTFARVDIEGVWYYGLKEWFDEKGEVKYKYAF